VTIALSAAEGAEFLAPYALPLVAQAIVGTADDAARAALSFGCPVALKLIAEGLSHKSNVGGVKLGVSDPGEVRQLAGELLALGQTIGDAGARVLVQPMVTGIAELIIGIGDDPTFGPVIAVGIGGTLTELFEDIAIGVAPLSRSDAFSLLASLRASALLDGFRGSPLADKDAVVDVILAVSRIALDGMVKELDLNPVIVRELGSGCIIVDNRVVLAKARE